ncbi:MAG: hypothetical protein ACI33S_04205 [Bacilli bacterium]
MCIHIREQHVKEASAKIKELRNKKDEIAEEKEKVFSCNKVLSCAIEKVTDAYSNLSVGFISGGEPFCEGGQFRNSGGLSSQIKNMQNIASELDARQEELQKMISLIWEEIIEQQMIINDPPDTGDCEACRIKNQVVYDHRNYNGSSIKNVALLK